MLPNVRKKPVLFRLEPWPIQRRSKEKKKRGSDRERAAQFKSWKLHEFPEKALLRKVAAVGAAELDAKVAPAPQLMFASIEPKAHSVPPTVPPAASESSKMQDNTGQTKLPSPHCCRTVAQFRSKLLTQVGLASETQCYSFSVLCY